MTNQTDYEAVLAGWRESAFYWEKNFEIVRRMFAPITEAMIEEGGIRPGHTVLDLAGGAGEPSIRLAEIVGPAGRITCTDAAAEMAEAARRRAAGLDNIDFQVCSADALPFADSAFDRVTCRLGLMFFPDPPRAASEMLRVVKPGGRVTLAVWGGPQFNPFFTAVTDAMAPFFDAPPADPDAPGAFRFAEPGRAARLLEDAGFDDVRERALDFHISALLSVDEFWNLRVELSDSLREKLARLTPEDGQRAAAAVKEAVAPYFPLGQMRFPSRALIVTGGKKDSSET